MPLDTSLSETIAFLRNAMSHLETCIRDAEKLKDIISINHSLRGVQRDMQEQWRLLNNHIQHIGGSPVTEPPEWDA